MESSIPKRHGARIPPRLLSEGALSRRAAEGDTDAFEEVFRRYHQQLFRYCRSIVGDEQDALDVLQNTMGKALAKLPGEAREIRLKPWLFRVAHNECIDAIEARRPTVDIGEAGLESRSRVESEVADRERLRQVLEDVERLPYNQRGALVMRELNGVGYEDIASALEVSPAAAKQTVFEARLALREMEAGRSMRCEQAMEAISAGDGRVMRGRKLRAHLRSCESCRAFRSGIEGRQEALRSLVPFLPAAAAASILGGLGGGGGGGLGGGLIALFGGGGAGAGAKAAAVVAVTAGIGAGTIGVVAEVNSERPVRGGSEVQTGPGDGRSGPGSIYSGAGYRVEAPAGDGGAPASEPRQSRPEGWRPQSANGRSSGNLTPGNEAEGSVEAKPGERPGSPPGLEPGSGSGAPGRSAEAPGRSVSAGAPGNAGSAAARGSRRGSDRAPGRASKPPASASSLRTEAPKPTDRAPKPVSQAPGKAAEPGPSAPAGAANRDRRGASR